MKDEGLGAAAAAAITAVVLITGGLFITQTETGKSLAEDLSDASKFFNFSTKRVSVEQVLENPQEYIGENVSVKGYYQTPPVYTTKNGYKDVHLSEYSEYKKYANNPKLKTLVPDNAVVSRGIEYRFVGVIEKKGDTVQLRAENVEPA